MTSYDEASLRQAIAVILARAVPGKPAAVVDIASVGVTTFEVGCDRLGIPFQRQKSLVSWPELASGAPFEVPSGELIYVRSSDGPPALAMLTRLKAPRNDAPVWVLPGASVTDLFKEVMSDFPTKLDYELLAVSVDEMANRVRLTSTRIFNRGVTRGERATARFRILDNGQPTLLAMVARDGRVPEVLSVSQVRLLPGEHELQAELLGPGKVRFLSPAGVQPYDGDLKEHIDRVPSALNSIREAHLICATEISGPAARVASRLYLAERLIKHLHRQFPELGQLQVSAIGYGAHRFEPKSTDDRLIVAPWLGTPLDAIRSLGTFGASEHGYQEAAQVEDMLAEVASRLSQAQPACRTVLLILGDRPPHSAAEGATRRPCPHGRDWRTALKQLTVSWNVFIAPIRDDLSALGAATWANLATTRVLAADSVDFDALWREAGLVKPAISHVPFPVVT